MDKERESAVLLNMLPEIGPKRFMNLIAFFSKPSAALDAHPDILKTVEDITEPLAQKIAKARNSIDVVKEIELAEKLGVEIVLWTDKSYPENLKNIHGYPAVLYVRGGIKSADTFSVGVVGTRRPTNYGKAVAAKFARDMGQAGVTTVSGLARGIDTEVHKASLEAGGRTIAVVGSGLNEHYPPENGKLEDMIARGGAVISEFPLNQFPDRQNFPRRNRLIAGLSLGTVVVEADIKSGALITAKFALEQGKDVFSVPGPITSAYSKGTNYLIKSGAQLVESADEIIEALKPVASWSRKIRNSSSAGKADAVLPAVKSDVLDYIKNYSDGVSIEVISRDLKKPVNEIAVSLFDLEIKGCVKSLPGKIYVSVI